MIVAGKRKLLEWGFGGNRGGAAAASSSAAAAGGGNGFWGTPQRSQRSMPHAAVIHEGRRALNS